MMIGEGGGEAATDGRRDGGGDGVRLDGMTYLSQTCGGGEGVLLDGITYFPDGEEMISSLGVGFGVLEAPMALSFLRTASMRSLRSDEIEV